MSDIVGLFAEELLHLENQYDEMGFSVDFTGEEYPPRITMKSREPPLFVTAADGARQVKDPAVVEIIGSPETQVVVRGTSRLGKKIYRRWQTVRRKC